MKIDRLKMLLLELGTEFAPDNVTSTVYYFFQNRWHTLDDNTQLPITITSHLVKAEDEAIAYHTPKDRVAWFSCKAAHCSVALKFQNSPRVETRQNARKRLEQVILRANNAYKVAHNPLTFLLARDELRDRVGKNIESLAILNPSGAAVDETVPQILAILALDIDHFKQVNDTYGHLYGDQVLKTFALRLEKTAQILRSESNGDCLIDLGHPSGEEFLISIRGSLTKEQILDWGNKFRINICDRALPTDDEWDSLIGRDNLTSVVAPPLHERYVSTSLGVAFHSHFSHQEPKPEQVTRLLEQADTALYRAKAAGRNQVVSFDSIMNECGRVLEQDKSTRVIAIDIGKNVGVTVGQEFRIFSPSFTGKKKFIVSDGRTVRTLGTYPKVELSRITVFDVQPELSFAFISNATEQALEIEAGCHLEAIPIGSIGHALPQFAKYFHASMVGVKIGDISSLQSLIKEERHAKRDPFAIVFRFSRSAEYLKRYGSAALNESLTRLFRSISAEFTIPSTTGVLDASTVCVVGIKPAYDNNAVIALAKRLREEYPELGVVVGAFSEKDIEKKPKDTKSVLSSEHAIEFARFAASDHAIEPQVPVAHFSHDLANTILARQRENRALLSAAADYEKLILLGVESAYIINQGGIIYTSLGETNRAADLFLIASKKSPKVLTFKSNFGIVCNSLGEDGVDKALELLNALTDQELNSLESAHTYGFVTYARLLAKAKLSGSSNFEPTRFARIAQVALNTDGYINTSQSKVITEALNIQ